MNKIAAIFLSVFLAVSSFVMPSSFPEEDPISELSDDSRLSVPKESFIKAMDYMQKGEKEFPRRAGQAEKLFEHSESYLTKAIFFYRDTGEQTELDVSHEIAVCERQLRKVHVWTGKARKKRMHGYR